jgi:hypothetical protein
LDFVDLGPATMTNDNRPGLNDLARGLQRKLEEFGDNNVADASEADSYMEKIKSAVRPLLTSPALKARDSRWILSPTSDLWLVPFSAMKSEDGKFAVESHVISYEIAGRDVMKDDYKNPPRAAHASLFVIGLPDFNRPLNVGTPQSYQRAAPHAASGVQVCSTGLNRKERFTGDAMLSAFLISELEKEGSAMLTGEMSGVQNTDLKNAAKCARSACLVDCPPPWWRPCYPPCYPPWNAPCHPPCLPCEPAPQTKPRAREKAHLLGGELQDRYSLNELQEISGLPDYLARLTQEAAPRARVKILTGAKARKDSFEQAFDRANEYKTIILLTHGFFLDPASANADPRLRARLVANPDPLSRCGMILSGYNAWRERVADQAVISGDPSNGVLTAREVTETCHLDGVSLVALIGCGTGVGEYFNGDSLASLRYGFSRAGAQGVLGTSWSVQTASSAKVMNAFFKAGATSAETPDKLLHEAQTAFIKAQRAAQSDKIHPFYWASFSITR